MKKLLFGLFISIISLACSSEKNETPDLTELLPNNSEYIIDTPDIAKFLQQTDTVEFYKNYSSFLTPGIKAGLHTLVTHSKQRSAIISINKNEHGQLNYVYIARGNPGEILIDSLKDISLETLTYKDYTIRKYVINNITIYNAEKKGIFIAGSSRPQLEKILEKGHEGMTDATFLKAHAAIDREKTSILLRDTALTDILSQSFGKISIPQLDIARWNVIEPEPGMSSVSLNGIATWDTDNGQLLQVFSNTGTQINQIATITPANAAGFYSFTYEDIGKLHSNLEKFNKSGTDLPANHFIYYTGEAGVITLNNTTKLPVFKTTDPELVNDLLTPVQETEDFRGTSIFYVPEDWDILSYLSPLIPNLDLSYYIWIDDFIIFAENKSDLEEVISSHQNNLTLDKAAYYSQAMENLAAASSLLFVSNNIGLSSRVDGNKESEGSTTYPIITMQFVVEKDFAHIHAAYGSAEDPKTTNAAQIAAINLDAPVGTLPYTLKNHLNGQPEVMVQDEKNMLYLFSSSGSLIWKKQFDHQITGGIEQVDILKNGNLHYAFSTPYALHILDRKGNYVKPFPLQFKEEITQPLSIFDYDNNRTYRFVLTQGNDVLMYDSKGKLVRGFDFDKLTSQIIQPPKHIRLNNKDYILIPEASGKLNILSRQGKSRIDVKEDIDFSASKWFPHKNNFVSISSKGNLITVNENGNISSLPAGENGNVKLAANDKFLVTMADNTLKINEHVVNLDYGLYTSPIIFNSGKRNFVSITDTQAQRVYIFDEEANLLPGFPLYGNSEISPISNGSNSNIFSVKGGENEIILYKF